MLIKLLINQDVKNSTTNLLTVITSQEDHDLTDSIGRIDIIGLFDKHEAILAGITLASSANIIDRPLFIRGETDNGWFTCQINRQTGEIAMSSEGRIHNDSVFLVLEVEVVNLNRRPV